MLKVNKGLPIYALSIALIFLGISLNLNNQKTKNELPEISQLQKQIWELQHTLFRHELCQDINLDQIKYQQPQQLKSCFASPSDWQKAPEYRSK